MQGAAAAAGVFGDFMMDFAWAGANPPWENWPFKDDPCDNDEGN